MRILLLVTDLQRGGTPMRVVRWARWMPRIGVEPVVGCLASRGPLSDTLDQLGIANFACDARHRFDLGLLLRLGRRIAEANPDVIHSFLFHANLAARLVGRLDRSRRVITSTATIEIERRWHRWLEALTRGMSDVHTVNAPAVARHMVDELGFNPQRVVIIPNGIDLEAVDAAPAADRACLGLPAGVPLIAWAGRMDPVKDLETWIEVFDQVRARRAVCGLLMGDGPLRPRVEQILRDRELDGSAGIGPAMIGRVRVAGWVDNVVPLLRAADLMLFTARTEGNPNAVIEAMAARRCVVATAVGGCRDLIQSGTSGWLCAPAAVGELARCVDEAIGDSASRERMGAAARRVIESRESMSCVLDRLNAIYRTGH